MYVQHFGLEHEPFSIAPDPRYLYLSERHREALAHLTYGLGAGGGVVLLTGEIGAGKTTVCRCFVEQMPADCRIAYIFNPKLTVTELLTSVCEEFGVALPAPEREQTVKTRLDPLNRFLLEQHAAGCNCVLVIDEAQLLSAEVLEQLRLLTNLETSERKLLQIILVGQPELRTMLAQPGLEQLAQRVIARYHLGALDEVDTGRYLQHRLELAGLRGPSPLGPDLLRSIHRRTGGIPRRINRLCDRALLGAFGQGRAFVDPPTLRRAADEVEGVEGVDATAARRWFRRGSAAGWGKMGGATAAGAIGGVAAMLIWTHAGDQPAAGVRATASGSLAAAVAEPADESVKPAQRTASAAADVIPPDIGLAELRQLVGHAALSEQAAWQQLADQWGLQLGSGEACLAAARHRLGCYRSDGGIALVRQLARPGIIELDDRVTTGDQRLLLVGLDPRFATLLIGGEQRRLSLIDLASIWNGGFATFWRVPDPLLQPAPDDGSEPLAGWLSQRLTRIDGGNEQPDLRRIDAALRERLLKFQRAQGLVADGIPGPRTLMALNRATGVDEPRLASER